jgi:hypothetical protein
MIATYCSGGHACRLIPKEEGASPKVGEMNKCSAHLPNGVHRVYCALTRGYVNLEKHEREED